MSFSNSIYFPVCPFLRFQQVHFVVLFQQSGQMEEPRFEFLVTTNSTNIENSHTKDDNVVLKTIQVEVDTNLILYG